MRHVGDEVLPDLVGTPKLRYVVEHQGHPPLGIRRERPRTGEHNLGRVGVQPHLVPRLGRAEGHASNHPRHLWVTDQLDIRAPGRLAFDPEHPFDRVVCDLDPARLVDHEHTLDHPTQNGACPRLLTRQVPHTAAQLPCRVVKRLGHDAQLVAPRVAAKSGQIAQGIPLGRVGDHRDPPTDTRRDDPREEQRATEGHQ